MAAPKVEVGLDKIEQHARSLGAFESLGQELHVHVVAVVPDCINGLGSGLDESRAAMGICAGHCRHAGVGQGNALSAAVGQRTCHGCEVVVVGQGEGIHVCFVAEVVRAVRAIGALDVTEEAAGQLVNILDVVAVLGCLVAHLFDVFVALEVGGQGFLEHIPGQLLGVVDEVLDGVEGVDSVNTGSSDAQGLGVLGTAGFLAQAGFDAAVKQAGAEDVGNNLFAGTVAEIAYLALGVIGVIHVLQQGLVDFLKGIALFDRLHFGEDLLAGMRIVAIVHGEFHKLGQIGLTFEGHIGAATLHACAHAAEDDGLGAGFVQGDATRGEADQGAGHCCVHVHELGLTGAAAHNVHSLFEVFGLHLRSVEEGQGGLDVVHGDLGIHQQHFQIVGSVVTIGSVATKGDGLAGVAGEGLGVGIALVDRDFKVLHPLALQQGEDLFLGQGAFVNVLLVEGIHVLAVATKRVTAATLLDFDAAVGEPEGLHGFTEVAGRILGNTAADFGDFQKLGLHLGIRFLGGRFFGQIGVTVGVGDDRIQSNLAGTVEFYLGPVGGVLGQGLVGSVNFLQNAAQTLVEDRRIVGNTGTRRVVVHRVDPAALYEQFGIAAIQFLVELVGAIVGSLALPGLVDLLQNGLGLVGEADFTERGQSELFGIQVVLDPVALPFGVGIDHGHAACQAADNGIAVKVNLLVGQDLLEEAGAGDEYAFALALVVGFGKELQALRIHLLIGIQKGLLLGVDAFVQGFPVDCVSHIGLHMYNIGSDAMLRICHCGRMAACLVW